jgi:Fe-S-cluster-containing hydrogenase component 2
LPDVFVLVVAPDRCTDCRKCVNACERTHGHARIYKISEDAPPVTCLQCDDAPCANVCPVDAIVEEGDSWIVTEDCVGCGLCAVACPFGAIEIVNGRADKCTLCVDAPKKVPACVEACDRGALKLVSKSQVAEEKRERFAIEMERIYRTLAKLESEEGSLRGESGNRG